MFSPSLDIDIGDLLLLIVVLLVSKYLLVTANSPINIFACVSSRFSFLLTSFSYLECVSFSTFCFTSEFLSAISQKFNQESKEIYFPQGRKHCFTYVCFYVCFLLFLYSTQKKVILFFVNASYII